MKIIIENVILSGRYELSDMLRKIDPLWIQGDLTEEDKDALVKLAQAHATPEYSYAPLQQQIDALVSHLNLLKDGVAAIEAGTLADPEAEEGYPAYKQPQGAHAYYNGYAVTFEGSRYICTTPDGVACVWSPTVFPAYWEKVV